MKKLILSQLVLMLFASVFLLSCGDDDEAPQVLLPNTEGFYVFGANTLYETPTEMGAKMPKARLDPSKGLGLSDRVGTLGKIMYIGANAKVQFAEVIGGVGKLYGSSDVVTENGVEFSMDDNVIHGTIEENAAAIAVADEGLYYVFVDTNLGTFLIAKVKAQMIGDAMSDHGWDASVPLAVKSTSKAETVFEGTNIKMGFGGGFKYRLNEGYHFYHDEDISTHSFLGVEDYQTAWDNQHSDLGYFAPNIPSFKAGNYIVTLTYTESTTGGEGVWEQLMLLDYSTFDVGFFGNAFFISEGVEGSWGDQGGVKKPTKVGNVYTWTWNDFELIADREFIIRQNATWEGILGVYNGNTVRAGSAFDTKVTKAGEGENFKVLVGGIYDITFSIDAATNVQTLTIN